MGTSDVTDALANIKTYTFQNPTSTPPPPPPPYPRNHGRAYSIDKEYQNILFEDQSAVSERWI